MASGYEVVDEVRFGDQEVSQEQVESEWKTIRAVFPNFADLPSERGVSTDSPNLKCHGFEWRIELFPGGHSTSSEEDVFVSLFLRSVSCTNTNKIRARSSFRVPSAGSTEFDEPFNIYAPRVVVDEGPSWGNITYVKREDILDPSRNYLVDGNLTVEVDIKVMLNEPTTWMPSNTVCSDMLKILDVADAENADITFEVGSGDCKELLYAHGLILTTRCPTLASLAEDCDPDTPIPIGDVQADVFRMLLRFVYGGKIPSKEVIKDQAKGIIHAADKYGCTGLKLAAEAKLATAGITTANAAELILFSDATNCAMLKEVTMEFFVNNAQVVMASEGFEQVAESPETMREMMAAMASVSTKRPASSETDDERDYKRMRVSTLRQKLQ